MGKKRGFIPFDASPGEADARNAEIAVVKAALRAEEEAAGRVYDPERFILSMVDDSLRCGVWTYQPR